MVQADLRLLLKQERERRKRLAATAGGEHSSRGAACDRLQLLESSAAAQRPLPWTALSVGSSLVEGLAYVPDFLSPEDAAAVVSSIETSAKPWVSSGERRMQNWGGKPGRREAVEAGSPLKELPPFLASLVDRLVACGAYRREEAPNHVLINEYACGAGIPPHQDGPLYLDRVATITLLGSALLQMHRTGAASCDEAELVTVLLRPGCLFLCTGKAYSDCLHSIASAREDVIGASCCNAAFAGAAPGDTVSRAPKRFSLVFVHKKQLRFKSIAQQSHLER